MKPIQEKKKTRPCWSTTFKTGILWAFPFIGLSLGARHSREMSKLIVSWRKFKVCQKFEITTSQFRVFNSFTYETDGAHIKVDLGRTFYEYPPALHCSFMLKYLNRKARPKQPPSEARAYHAARAGRRCEFQGMEKRETSGWRSGCFGTWSGCRHSADLMSYPTGRMLICSTLMHLTDKRCLVARSWSPWCIFNQRWNICVGLFPPNRSKAGRTIT